VTQLSRTPVRIRDPIHGTISIARAEIALVDAPAYQRLRAIKQLGLADLAFPGATHSRYAHGLGTLHVASEMLANATRDFALEPADALRLRTTVRLAALFHDLGHPPLSHATEAFMPPVAALALGKWQVGPSDRRATHEDYTLKLLLDSELTRRFDLGVTPETGVTAEDVACVVAGRTAGRPLVFGGRDFMPLCRQLVSSELDADRMDYLLRDSYFTGVPYGRYDHAWILENLLPIEREKAVYLGLDARASFAFEDFLLSRYHMFVSVYYHQVPIGYELMLKRYVDTQQGEMVVPSAVEDYLYCDDVYLWHVLRTSKNPWAKRITERRAYRALVEVKSFDGDPTPGGEVDVDLVLQALADRQIDAMAHSAKGALSKYFGAGLSLPLGARTVDPPLWVSDGGRVVALDAYTPLYARYAGAVHLRRVYVAPENAAAAKAILAGLRTR